MRIKALVEDFVVEEELAAPLGPHGPYGVYRVTKKRITSLQLQERLAERLGIPKAAVIVPAMKDKDAVAVQHLAVRGRGPARTAAKGFEAVLVGRSSSPLGPSHVKGNRFTIVVRELTPGEVSTLETRSGEVTQHGLPNYFDTQRFGSAVAGQEPIGKLILRGDAEESLRSYLARPMAGDTPTMRRFKAEASQHWDEWQHLFEIAPRSNQRSVLNFLKDHPGELRKALNLVDPRLLALYLSAYQSELWNRTAACFIQARSHTLAHTLGGTPGAVEVAGRLLPLYQVLPAEVLQELRQLTLPLLHHRTTFRSEEVKACAERVLREEDMGLETFKARLLRRAYLSKGERPLLLVPQALAVGQVQEDELSRGKLRATLTFALPRGSYATLVVKALFAAISS